MSAAELGQISRHLAAIAATGLPFAKALELVVVSPSNSRLARLFEQLKADCAAGETFASAVRKRQKEAGTLFCDCVAHGEESGTLSLILAHIAEFYESEGAFSARLSRLWRQQAAVFIALAGLLCTLAYLFVPLALDSEALSWQGIPISPFAAGAVILLLPIFVAVTALFLGLGRHRWILLGAPFAGDLIRHGVLRRSARLLGVLIPGGMTVESAASVVRNCAPDSAKAVDSLVSPLYPRDQRKSRSLLPPLMADQLRSAAVPQPLGDTLKHIGEFYESELEGFTKAALLLGGPLFIVLLGIAGTSLLLVL